MVNRTYSITDIVDQVGGGDTFAAGLIYGLLTYQDEKKDLEFVVGASCLKHAIPGDFNHVNSKEIERWVAGDGTGRIQRLWFRKQHLWPSLTRFYSNYIKSPLVISRGCHTLSLANLKRLSAFLYIEPLI